MPAVTTGNRHKVCDGVYHQCRTIEELILRVVPDELQPENKLGGENYEWLIETKISGG
jgi:hypothetical protein